VILVTSFGRVESIRRLKPDTDHKPFSHDFIIGSQLGREVEPGVVDIGPCAAI